MWRDRVSNPGPLTYEPGALPTDKIRKIIPKLSLLIWSTDNW